MDSSFVHNALFKSLYPDIFEHVSQLNFTVPQVVTFFDDGNGYNAEVTYE